MTTLLPPAKCQFSDANGVPLAGGSVFFYIPGTTTFKNTWQDSGQVTLNTNPIVLDSAGEAIIFGSGSYRQIVKDSLGNTIWDQLTSSTDATGIALGGALRGYLGGLTCSNNSTTKINVSAGICTDDTNSFLMGFLAGTIDCGIVGPNGLDAGALANNIWYHIFGIAQPAGVSPALLASTSLSPAMPVSYTLKRRIGSFKTATGASTILGFSQLGDEFLWTTVVVDANALNIADATGHLAPLTVPPGVQVNALFHGAITAGAGGSISLTFSSPDETDQASTTTNADLFVAASASEAGQFNYRTDTSRQIRYRASGPTGVLVYIGTRGWIDTRGRFS